MYFYDTILVKFSHINMKITKLIKKIKQIFRADNADDSPFKKHYALAKEAIKEFRTIGLQQLQELEAKLESMPENIVTLFYKEQVKSFWKDTDFFLDLGKLKNKDYTALPARLMFTRVLKLIYLTHQNETKREELCRKDFLRFAQVFYKTAGIEEKKQYYKDQFDFFSGSLTVDIEGSRIVSFPDTKSMINKAFLAESDQMYNIYQDYSEFEHGNIMYSFMDNKYYPSTFGTVGRFVVEVVKLTDWHLHEGKFSEEIKKKLEEFNEKNKELDELLRSDDE